MVLPALPLVIVGVLAAPEAKGMFPLLPIRILFFAESMSLVLDLANN